MAQDVHDPRQQPSELGHNLDDQLCEKPEVTLEQSQHFRNGSNNGSEPLEPSHPDALDSSGNASRNPDTSSAEDAGNRQQLSEKRNLRTLPAWIYSLEHAENEDEPAVTARLLPPQPDDAVVAQHNYLPYATSGSGYGRGRRFDEEAGIGPHRESRWKSFSKTNAYPREHGVEGESITPEWLNENYGDYSQPWRGRHVPTEDTEDLLREKQRRKIWFIRFHNTLLKSPIVPLIFRLTVWCFSLIALALGGSIYHLSKEYDIFQGPSALMAIIVDGFALVYLVYITWDEYTSKPLGLRPPAAKARLVLLDIFFIVFESANLSLAFAALSSVNGACKVAEINHQISFKNDAICHRQIALACVLLVALIAWLTTFSISVLRLVERVAK